MMAIADSSTGEAKIIGDEYMISFAWDTLKCGNKEYYMEVLFFRPFSNGWSYKKDHENRIVKQDSICKILTR
ncbi:MAG: hypothetical protein ABIT96_06230 [Ferruginibacter sp.]